MHRHNRNGERHKERVIESHKNGQFYISAEQACTFDCERTNSVLSFLFKFCPAE